MSPLIPGNNAHLLPLAIVVDNLLCLHLRFSVLLLMVTILIVSMISIMSVNLMIIARLQDHNLLPDSNITIMRLMNAINNKCSLMIVILLPQDHNSLPIITVLLHRRHLPDSTKVLSRHIAKNLNRSMMTTIILLHPIAAQVIPILILPMMVEMEDINRIQAIDPLTGQTFGVFF
jgi:hypothetical protein